MGLFKSIAKIGLAPVTGGLSLFAGGGGGGVKDLLFGSPEQQAKYQQIALTKAQLDENKRRGRVLGEAEKIAMAEPTDLKANIQQEQAQKERLARGAYEDERRRLQDVIRQRGLGSSSVGLGQIAGQQRRLSENLANIRAQTPSLFRAEKERQQQLKFGRLSGLGGLSPLQTPGGYMQDPAQRGGGLFDLATTIGGGAIGAAYGGPMGAMLGAQMGRGVGQTGRGLFG